MRKVYVIDDSLSVCKAIEKMLQPRGIEVVIRLDGQDALAELPQEAPDLIICDVLMPKMDGFEVCRTVKTTEGLRSVPFILISGIVDEKVRNRARDVSADGLFKKPFTGDSFLKGVDSFLRSSTPPRSEGQWNISARRNESTSRHGISRWFSRESFSSLCEVDGFLFSSLVAPDGKPEFLEGRQPEDLDRVAREIHKVTRASAAISAQLSHGDFMEVILESDQGVLLVEKIDRHLELIVGIRSMSSLGKIRYLIRKIQKKLKRNRVEREADSHGTATGTFSEERTG